MLKKILILLTIPFSISVNAELIQLTVDIDGGFSGGGIIPGTNTGSGVGTYNSQTGELNLSYSYRSMSSIVDFKLDQQLSVNVFSDTSLSKITTACYEDVGLASQCPGVILDQPDNSPIAEMDFNNGNGFINTSILYIGVPGVPDGMTNTMNYNITAVPVPAAAWLFGSALIGVIGLKRKK